MKGEFKTKTEFQIGDYAWFTRTPHQMRQARIITEPTAYKILQIGTKNDGIARHSVYNTRYGAFYDYQIGRTVFHSREEAIAQIRKEPPYEK